MGACCSGALISAIVTLIRPDNEFDWTETKKINPRAREMERRRAISSVDSKSMSNDEEEPTSSEKEKSEATTRASSVKEDASVDIGDAGNLESLRKSLKVATWASSIMTFIVLFVCLSHFVHLYQTHDLHLTAHPNSHVLIALRVFTDVFQGVDYCVHYMALCGSWDNICPTAVGEPRCYDEHLPGTRQGYHWEKASK